jgi:hypothetical protein
MAVEAWSMAFHARHVYDMIIPGITYSDESGSASTTKRKSTQTVKDRERSQETGVTASFTRSSLPNSSNLRLQISSHYTITLSSHKFEDIELSTSTYDQSAGTALNSTSAHRSLGEPAVESRQSSSIWGPKDQYGAMPSM